MKYIVYKNKYSNAAFCYWSGCRNVCNYNCQVKTVEPTDPEPEE